MSTTSPYPRTYRHPAWAVIFGLVMGLVFIGGGLGLAWMGRDSSVWHLGLIGALVSVGFGAYMLAGPLRAKVILRATSIESRGMLASRRLEREEISHLHKRPSRGVQLSLVPNTGREPLEIPSGIDLDALFDQWVAGIPDRDAEELQAAEQALLSNPALGIGVEERRERLKKGRTFAKAASSASVFVVLWVALYPHPYDLALAACVLMPAIAVAISTASREFYRIGPGPAHPNLGALVLTPPIVLWIRATMDVDLFDVQRALVAGLLGGGVLTLGLAGLLTHVRSQRTSVSVFGILLCLYAYGAIVLGNARFDSGPVSIYDAEVVARRESSGRNSSRHLRLGAWGPEKEINGVQVDRDFYDRVRVGDVICVNLMPGALGIRWYVVEACR